jgi:hypothetical protein
MDANDALNVFEQLPVWERLAINVALCFQLNKTADEGPLFKHCKTLSTASPIASL